MENGYKGFSGTYEISIKDGFYYINKVGFKKMPVFGSVTKDKEKIKQIMFEVLGHKKFTIPKL